MQAEVIEFMATAALTELKDLVERNRETLVITDVLEIDSVNRSINNVTNISHIETILQTICKMAEADKFGGTRNDFQN